jgi:hypothetical protein
MLALRRLWLVIFVLVTPPATAALLYYGSIALLAAANRVIDPQILRSAAIGDIVLFAVFCLWEAKNRWSS